MDALLNRLNSLNLGPSDLQHDISVILESWMYELPEMDVSRFKIKPGSFNTTQDLYNEMSKTLHSFNLIDIMPYVDEYLEYYENITCIPGESNSESIESIDEIMD